MLDLVLVDFDDTLVETAPAFQASREALFRRLEEAGFPREEAERVHHREVEPELLKVHGMGPFRMEPSFRETYRRLCRAREREPDPRITEECGRMGRNFLGHPRVMEGSLEALEKVAEALPTILYSQASHHHYQMGRIRDAGVLDLLPEDRIRIVPRKTADAFRKALDAFGVAEPTRAVMVGNSLRSDINPALEAGARAILVEPYEMWEYDRVPPFSEDFVRFETFPEAVGHLLRRPEDPRV